MNMLLVPVDFSDTSIHAAKYAAALSRQIPEAAILLYHSTISTDKKGMDEDEIHTEALRSIGLLVADIKTIAPDCAIETVVNDGYLFENIKSLSDSHHAALIVMGITGKNKLEQKLIGSNTTKIALESGLPVLIIHKHVMYQPVKSMALALHLKDHLMETTPHEAINNLASLLQAKLMVVNVDNEDSDTPAQYVYSGQQAAHLMFDKTGATYHMLTGNNVEDSLIDFAKEQKVDIIINIAKKHNWLESLLKGSITNKLAFDAVLPILCIREKQ